MLCKALGQGHQFSCLKGLREPPMPLATNMWMPFRWKTQWSSVTTFTIELNDIRFDGIRKASGARVLNTSLVSWPTVRYQLVRVPDGRVVVKTDVHRNFQGASKASHCHTTWMASSPCTRQKADGAKYYDQVGGAMNGTRKLNLPFFFLICNFAIYFKTARHPFPHRWLKQHASGVSYSVRTNSSH